MCSPTVMTARYPALRASFCELDHGSAMIKELRSCERVIVVTAA